MTLNVSSIGDNVQVPSITAQTYLPDQLIVDPRMLVTQPIVLASGTLKRGTVLGQQTTAAIEVAAGTNTGNGTVGSTSLGASPEFGVYTLKATSATVFAVTDPEGNALGNATVGTAFTSSEVNFTITAGGTAFVANDSFTLTVLNATGNFIESVKTASDGSQTPVAVLADDADASSGPVSAGAYVSGEFNFHALTYDASWTPQTLMAAVKAPLFIKRTGLGLTNTDPS
jgi:hypothetical protein